MGETGAMAGRRLRIVDDVRTRRRTMRQEARDVRRGIDLITPSSSPDDCDLEPGRVQPKMTRAAANAEKNRQQVAERLKEWKKKKEIMTKELRKARPPFNNYVRVKHTGLTPYKNRMARSAQAKPPPPQPNLPATAKTGRNLPSPPKTRQTLASRQTAKSTTRPAAKTAVSKTQNPPVPNYPTGVVNFGLPPHLMAPKAFRPPSNIRPLPLEVVKKGPVTKASIKISPPTTLKMVQKKLPPPTSTKTVKAAPAAGRRAAPSAATGARVLKSIQPTAAQKTKGGKLPLQKIPLCIPSKPLIPTRTTRSAVKTRAS